MHKSSSSTKTRNGRTVSCGDLSLRRGRRGALPEWTVVVSAWSDAEQTRGVIVGFADCG